MKKLNNFIINKWYSYLNKIDKEEITFLNYGFANERTIVLNKEDEHNRYPIQLYNHITNATNLEGLDILEVGCGRGGGVSYINKYLKPNSIIGIDLCEEAIEFCNKHYPELSFTSGDATNLYFNENSFDVVVNIESSHNYENMNKFLKEVKRVLKPQGYFLFADFRTGDIKSLKFSLSNCGLKIISEENITSNVVKALQLDSKRRNDIIKRKFPKIFHKFAKEFAGVEGTNSYNSFLYGKREYVYYVMQKKVENE